MFDAPSPDRNDLSIYDNVAGKWWSDEIRWVRTLKNMASGRMTYFDRHATWRGRRFLDLGCAGGFMSELMAARGAKVSGIDPAEDAIAAARAHAGQNALDIDYVTGVGENLPFADQTFDGVVCVDVLEHVQDLSKVLDEISRVTKADGLFLFDTINRNPIAAFATVTIAEDLVGLLPKGTHDPALYIKPTELTEKLVQRSFKVAKLTGLGPRGLDRRLDFVFGEVPSTAIIFMGHATKMR